MKLKLISTAILLLILNQFIYAQSNDKVDTHSMSYSFDLDQMNDLTDFALFNANGSIDVQGYDGNTIEIKVVKTIRAKRNDNLNRGLSEVTVESKQENGKLIIYSKTPCIELSSNKKLEWQYEYDCENSWSNSYEHYLEYIVKVPNHLNIDLRNISGKKVKASNFDNTEISLSNVSGSIELNNAKSNIVTLQTVSGIVVANQVESNELIANTVSGYIQLNEIAGTTNAKTVSGYISGSYLENPPKYSSFETLSGHIEIAFQNNLEAKVGYKIETSGSFNSDFNNLEIKNYGHGNSGNSCKENEAKATKNNRKSNDLDLYFKTMSGHISIQRT